MEMWVWEGLRGSEYNQNIKYENLKELSLTFRIWENQHNKIQTVVFIRVIYHLYLIDIDCILNVWKYINSEIHTQWQYFDKKKLPSRQTDLKPLKIE